MTAKRLRVLVAGIAGAALVLIALAVVLIARDDFIDLSNDPRGQEACDQLIQSIQYDGDPKIRMGSLLAAGEAALKARTPEIRDAAKPLGEGVDEFDGFGVADPDALTAACEKAGVEIPD